MGHSRWNENPPAAEQQGFAKFSRTKETALPVPRETRSGFRTRRNTGAHVVRRACWPTRDQRGAAAADRCPD